MPVQPLPYMVAIPIPTRDSRDAPLSVGRVTRATDTLLETLNRWFGGATLVPGPGAWTMVETGAICVDREQTMVVSITTEDAFDARADDLARLVSEVGDLLDQEAMAVLAYPETKGFLVFPEDP